jgi:predicted negative regulator of RcsB-dependent stress response
VKSERDKFSRPTSSAILALAGTLSQAGQLEEAAAELRIAIEQADDDDPALDELRRASVVDQIGSRSG